MSFKPKGIAPILVKPLNTILRNSEDMSAPDGVRVVIKVGDKFVKEGPDPSFPFQMVNDPRDAYAWQRVDIAMEAAQSLKQLFPRLSVFVQAYAPIGHSFELVKDLK